MGGSSKSVTVGYKYGIGFHMAVCYGPVDAVQEITVDDRVAWSGNETTGPGVFIYQPDLFGGEEREGGLNGDAWLMFGEDTQTPNTYLQSQLGATIPAFRGIFSIVWKGIVSANNPYLKPWAIKVKRILKGWYGGTPWYSAKAEITNAAGNDMNPVHITYQALTDPEWGMGYPVTALDDTNLRAVADTLYSEGFGLSLIWNQQGQIQSFIKTVMDHIGGILRVDPSTGKFVIKLLRADYDASSLPEYGPSQIAEMVSYQRAAWGETVNEVTLVYTDPVTGKDTGVTVQDLANIQSQGAVVSQRVNMPGIRSADLAMRVAMRELAVRSTPLAKAKFTINRNAWALLPGDVFKLTWPKYGVTSSVMRVLNVNTGTLDNGLITVDAAEDVFGLPDSSYAAQEPIGWTAPGSAPADAPNRQAFELPYWDLARTLSAADLSYVDALDGYLGVVAQRPSSDAYDYNLWTHGAGGSYEKRNQVTHCPVATLSVAIGLTDTVLHYTGGVDLDLVETGGYIIIGGEWCALDAIDTGAETITVKRGVLDTVPAAHSIGAVIWFADDFVGADSQLYQDSETVKAKAQTRTVKGVLDLASATEMSVTMNQRQARPYPPGKLRINGVAYPEVITGPIYITWAHRDRTQQTAYLVGQDEASIGPEAGTTYRVEIVGEGSTTTADTEFSWCAPTESTVTIKVGSTRDGLDSWQDHSVTIERAGWGYNWGKYWGGSPGAPDGTSLVHCAPAWIYTVNMSGAEILYQQFSITGGYIKFREATSTHAFRLTWFDSSDAQTANQSLGTRVSGIPAYDSIADCFFFAINEQTGDSGAHSPEIIHGLGKIAASGASIPTFNTGDLSYFVWFAQPFGSYVWVGESDGTANFNLKRFEPSTLALHDSTTVEAIPTAATVNGTRLYTLIYDPVTPQSTIAAYDSAVSRQWATVLPFAAIGLVYANGWLWTCNASAKTLIRLDLTGAVDTYSLALPAGMSDFRVTLCDSYLVVGMENTGTGAKPVIVDPASGLQIPRN